MVKLSGSAQYTNADGWLAGFLNSEPGNFWVWTILALGAGLACGYGIFHFIRRARIIEDTPTSKIRSASQGYVEIIGKVKYFASQPVTAPLTNLPCAWYHFTIQKRETVHTGKGTRTRWRTIEEKTSDRVFICDDATGECLIDPRGAEVYALSEDSWYGGTKWPQGGKPLKQGFFSARDYRYHESRIMEDEQLYALGHFNTVDPNKAHGDLSTEAGAILKVWKQDQVKLLQQFDTNQDGRIDQDEWEQARQSALQQAYQQRLTRSNRPSIHMLSGTKDFRRPYILSMYSPARMTRKYKLQAMACLLGFVALVPLSTWLIIVRLSA